MPGLPQVKRIHEYKRQFMNVLSIIHRYSQIKQMSASERKEVNPTSHTLTAHNMKPMLCHLFLRMVLTLHLIQI